MATSGTFGFTLQADDLLTEAFERCGLNPEVMSEAHARSGMRSLQLILLDWTAAGLNLWQVDRQVQAVSAGMDSFTTAAATLDLLELVVTVAGRDLMLSPIGRDTWMALPNKAQAGRPTQFWVERINRVPVVHLWPVPDQAYTLTYSRIRLPQDIGALALEADTPVLWLEALSAELAARLAVKYAPDRLTVLKGLAAEAFGKVASDNRERVPFHLTPALG